MKPLPDIQFDLPEWEERQFRLIRSAEKKVAAIGRKAGSGSDQFRNACRRLLEVVLTKKGNDILSHIKTSIDVRAFTYLLSSSYEFAKNITISRNILDHLLSIRSPVSRLTLTQLIRSFLVQFDEVADEQGLLDWCEFIKGSLSDYSAGSGSSELKRYAQHSDVIFSPFGPSRVVKYSQKEAIDFDGMLKRLGLTGFTDGRFLTLCRYQYYLETLKNIPAGENNSILPEICKPDVVNAPYTSDRQLGHEILSILIDNSEGQPLSESWQNTILTIAGDPRVPKTSENYQRWWALLGEKRITLMRGWLSRFDLKLFLKILEQSAKDGSDSDMERMFKPRKKFMEGLLKLGIVVESRLFLTHHAEDYLRRHYKNKNQDLPSFASVRGAPASVIYLRLSNDIHMVEGTHSFSIRLLNKLPTRSYLTDYSIQNHKSRAIGVGLGEFYLYEFGRDGGLLETAHNPDLGWQNKVISYLSSKGVPVDAGKLIHRDKYREYKSKYGVS